MIVSSVISASTHFQSSSTRTRRAYCNSYVCLHWLILPPNISGWVISDNARTHDRLTGREGNRLACKHQHFLVGKPRPFCCRSRCILGRKTTQTRGSLFMKPAHSFSRSHPLCAVQLESRLAALLASGAGAAVCRLASLAPTPPFPSPSRATPTTGPSCAHPAVLRTSPVRFSAVRKP